MDSYEIIITPDAEADLFEIRDYYDDIADEIFKLREKKEKTNIDTSDRDELSHPIS